MIEKHKANQYQQIRQNNQSILNNVTHQPGYVPVQVYNLQDDYFYTSLSHYRPLCYTGKGSPVLLVNKSWYLSLGCIMIMNTIFLLVIFLFLKGSDAGPRQISSQQTKKFTLINLASMLMINISYFLTQFLNPGVRNLSKITIQEYNHDGKVYCARCNGYRTKKIEHCTDCDACIENLDHHCGFFSKCIGGYQTYAFYCFLTFMFLGFLTLIVTMTTNIGL